MKPTQLEKLQYPQRTDNDHDPNWRSLFSPDCYCDRRSLTVPAEKPHTLSESLIYFEPVSSHSSIIIRRDTRSGDFINIKQGDDWTDEEIDQAIGQIIGQFDILECADCAKMVIGWLRERKIQGKILRLRTRYGEDYILSYRLEQIGITDSITINGQHFGVEVRGKVFDNLSSDGRSREDWLKDFQCHGGQFIVTELDCI
jgi:Papain fold toxin 2